jgi:hypothetical protein
MTSQVPPRRQAAARKRSGTVGAPVVGSLPGTVSGVGTMLAGVSGVGLGVVTTFGTVVTTLGGVVVALDTGVLGGTEGGVDEGGVLLGGVLDGGVDEGGTLDGGVVLGGTLVLGSDEGGTLLSGVLDGGVLSGVEDGGVESGVDEGGTLLSGRQCGLCSPSEPWPSSQCGGRLSVGTLVAVRSVPVLPADATPVKAAVPPRASAPTSSKCRALMVRKPTRMDEAQHGPFGPYSWGCSTHWWLQSGQSQAIVRSMPRL